MNRLVSTSASKRGGSSQGPPSSALLGFDRMWAELTRREATLASCCAETRDTTPTIFRDPRRLPRVSETPRKDPLPPPGPMPSVWADWERRQRADGAPTLDCGCEDAPRPARKRSMVQDPSGVREVSGDWLARALSLGGEAAARIAGKQVQMNAESFRAAQAALQSGPAWRRIRREVAKQRAQFWPAEAEQEEEEESQGKDAQPGGTWQVDAKARPITLSGTRVGPRLCACDEVYTLEEGPKYIDPVDGDDDGYGGFLFVELEVPGVPGATRWFSDFQPWKTLRKAMELLEYMASISRRYDWCWEGVQILLRRGRTFNGREEGPLPAVLWTNPVTNNYGAEAVHEIIGFKATAASPLIIGAYGEGDPPLLDGRIVTPTEPQYGDKRVALFLADCCYVQIHDLHFRGFGTAIAAAGACKHHVYHDLRLYELANTGIGFGSNERYAAFSVVGSWNNGAELGELVAAEGLYPERIIIYDCVFSSIGYDTANQDIGLGMFATNCTISRNTLTGDSVRGVDGITGNGASSGHLISQNTIADHRKFCRDQDKEVTLSSGDTTIPVGAMFVTSRTCPDAVHELQYRCDGTTETGGTCTDTAYGYTVLQIPAGDPLPDGVSGFGEDGIDLKAVRKRTPTAQDTTVICENIIYGNGGFSGICVNDGSQGVHICRNRIFLNKIGILVTNSEDNAWYQAEDYWTNKTSHVYIYRNLIYMNQEFGIKVASAFEVPAEDEDEEVNFEVEEVYIINNTIAHNLYAGLRLAVDDSAEWSVGDVPPVNEVHIHNNLFARNNLEEDPFDRNDSVQVTWSNFSPADGGDFSMDYNVYIGGWDGEPDLSKVIAVPGNSYSLSSFQSAFATLALEVNGQQSDDLADAAFVDEATLDDNVSTRDDLADFVNNASSAEALILLALDLDILVNSICVNEADQTFADAFVDAYGDLVPIATDFEGGTTACLDVGAFDSVGGSDLC